MAKKITQEEYNEYEKLLKKYQRMRRIIIKSHNATRDYSVKSSSRLPQLVAPERQSKVSLKAFRLSGRRIFALKIRHLKKLVSAGVQGFNKDIKSDYLSLWREYIFDGLKPEGKFGRYSPEQMHIQDEKTKQAMLLYNKMVGMNATLFVYMRNKDFIKNFKYYYNEFSSAGKFVSEDFISDTAKYIDMMNAMPKDRKEMLKKLLEGTGKTGENIDLRVIADIVEGKDYGEDTSKGIRRTRKTFSPRKVANNVKK